MNGTGAVIVTLLACSRLRPAVAWWGWSQLADVEMSTQGYIALALGVVATTALGVGLMWLVYFSHRRGYDDDVGRE